MAVGFHIINSSDNCPICFESMDNSDVVAHDGQGYKHPLHRKCLKNYIAIKNITKCISCQIPTDVSSLFSWKDKAIIELNHIKNDVYEGVDNVASALKMALEAGSVIVFTIGPGFAVLGDEEIAGEIGINIVTGTIGVLGAAVAGAAVGGAVVAGAAIGLGKARSTVRKAASIAVIIGGTVGAAFEVVALGRAEGLVAVVEVSVRGIVGGAVGGIAISVMNGIFRRNLLRIRI